MLPHSCFFLLSLCFCMEPVSFSLKECLLILPPRQGYCKSYSYWQQLIQWPFLLHYRDFLISSGILPSYSSLELRVNHSPSLPSSFLTTKAPHAVGFSSEALLHFILILPWTCGITSSIEWWLPIYRPSLCLPWKRNITKWYLNPSWAFPAEYPKDFIQRIFSSSVNDNFIFLLHQDFLTLPWSHPTSNWLANLLGSVVKTRPGSIYFSSIPSAVLASSIADLFYFNSVTPWFCL